MTYPTRTEVAYWLRGRGFDDLLKKEGIKLRKVTSLEKSVDRDLKVASHVATTVGD